VSDAKTFKSGMVTLVGRPNVGKSTLMNTFLGEHLAITTPKPQTTRDQIRGILNRDDAQIVFVDTPGIHEAKKPLNHVLVRRAIDALAGVDTALFLVDAVDYGRRKAGTLYKQDWRILGLLTEARVPVAAIINKVDMVRAKAKLLPLAELLLAEEAVEKVFFVSALDSDGTDDVLSYVLGKLPAGAPLYADDIVSDAPIRFHVAEIVRERVFMHTQQEVPYSAAVEIEMFDESQKPIYIAARIVVEKSSQKGILVGKGGEMIRRIRLGAQRRIKAFLDEPVRLELFVSVTRDWAHDEKGLRRLGYE
jgi:GTPase